MGNTMIRSIISRLLLPAALLTTFTFGQTDISGAISSNTTWDVSGSPYTISGNTAIMDGVTLTISPGVTVLFTQDVYLKALSGSTLIAQGTESDSIYFTTTNIVTNTFGVEFDIGAVGTSTNADTSYISGSVFEYCVFSNTNGRVIKTFAQLLFSNCLFTDNETTEGTVLVKNGIVAYRTIFKNNNVTGNAPGGGCGAAVNILADWPGLGGAEPSKFFNCEFTNNSASAWGGAICAKDAYVNVITIVNSQFISNSATAGGAIYSSGASIGGARNYSITGSLFEGNQSATEGGAIWQYYNHLESSDCLFINNLSSGSGGTIFSQRSGSNISNSKFIGNTSSGTGSVYQVGPSANDNVSIINSILLDNSSENITNGYLISQSTAYDSDGLISIDRCYIVAGGGIDEYAFSGVVTGEKNALINKVVALPSGGTNTIEFINNYWGTKSSSEIDNLIYDFNDDPNFNTPIVNYNPILLGPSNDLAGSPSLINSIHVLTDSLYQMEVTGSISDGDTLFLGIMGIDSDTDSRGLSSAWVINHTTLDTVTITLIETSENSGNYRGSIITDANTDDQNDVVQGRSGEILKIVSVNDPSIYTHVFIGDARFKVTLNVPNDYTTIQSALNNAGTGDTVLVQPGTYYENIFWPETNGIKLISAGDSSNTIIDGGGLSSVIYMNTQTVTIDTTTLIKGFCINNGSATYGGGIFSINAGLKLVQSALKNNTATQDGGGLYWSNGTSLIMMDCSILMNSTSVITPPLPANNSGGGLFLSGDTLSFKNILISNNTSARGGGVCIYGLTGVMENITIEHNASENWGGGVYLGGADIMFENSTIQSNTCQGSGGGLHINGGGCIFKNIGLINNSSENGAGVFADRSSTEFYDCTITTNIADDSGGGIHTTNDASSFSRCLIASNSANGNSHNSHGGAGVYFWYGSSSLKECIVVNNNAANRGGGIMVSGGQDLGAQITSTIVASNVSSEESGGIHCWNAQVYIDSVTIHGNTNGILIDGGTSNLNNTSISENGIWGIKIPANANPPLNGLNISSNGQGLVNLDNINLLSAPNLYWGDSSGPYHPSQNPSGQGDSINIFVNVIEPWLTSPNTDAPPIPAQNVIVSGTGNDFINLVWDSSPLGDFAGFKLYYDTDESGYPYDNSVDIGSSNTYALSGLNLGTEYFLAVTVYDTDGNESWYSNEVTGVTRVMEVQNLDIAGDEHLYHLITHDPIITFDYFDSMGETQTNYQLQISTDSTFQSNLIWDSGEVSSDATSIQNTEGALQNGVKYYLRARVASGSFWSNWTSLAFCMNTEPSMPVQLSLIDNEVTTSDLLLEISNSTDAEGDNLSYDFRLYDATQTVQLDSAIGVTEVAEGTIWEVITTLEDNAQHLWTVQAYDGYEYSELAGPESFLINFENDTPAGFNLTSPLIGEAIVSQSPLFTWAPAVDPDPLDTVRYVLYLDTPDPGVETFNVDIDTSFQLADVLEDNTSYHWKVVAQDLAGATTTSTGGYQSFTVNTSNDLPTAFTLLSPDNYAMVTTLTPEFLWEASSDPDDETIVMRSNVKNRKADQSSTGDNSVMVITGYDFYLSTDASLADAIPAEVFGTSYTPETALLENQVYYWTVSALDDSGGVTFSDTASFWTNSLNEAPSAFSLNSPANGEILLDISPTFIWGSSIEADLQDSFMFSLVLGSHPDLMDTIWSGTDTSLTLEWVLEDNATYYWGVFAQDESGLVTQNTSGYQSFTVNTANDLPTAFTLFSPDNYAMVTTLTPEFLWEASSDPDDETIVLRSNGKGHQADRSSTGDNSVMVITGYDFYISTEANLTDATPVEVLGTSYVPAEELLENQVYYWAVSALDDSGGVTFSDTASFWMNSENSAPAEFTLLTPVDDTESTTTPTFTWTLSSDADLNDTLNYTLRYGTDVFNLMDISNGSSPQFTVIEPLEDNTEYIWQVVAEDISGAVFSTEFSSFFVNSENDDPGVFSLIAPDSASWITNGDLMLVWEPSTDLEGADVEYVIHMGPDSESLDPVDTIGVNYYALDGLEDGYYFWQIEALDNLEGSQLSEMWSFLINVHNDPPDPFALTFPEADLVITEQQPTFTWEASSSGDAGDHTSYRVELGNTAENMGVIYEGDSTFYTPESPLEDNSVYYWRVIANDLAFATTVNEGGFQNFIVNTVNDAPSMAELISPDSVIVLSDTPVFNWTASMDIDPHDSLSYEVHWWTDQTEMDSIITTGTQASPASPLGYDNLQCTWNVITMDANGGIAHSEEKTFWVDFMPEVPGSFALLGPDSASAGNGTRPELTWAEAIDPDPFDAVHYSVAVATDSLMENVIYEQIAHVEVTIPEIDLENDTRYYWQVIAIDKDSLTTESSVWTFDVGYLAIDPYAQVPTEFVLDQNYPNPFNPSTTIRYGLPEESNVSLVIYDVRGQVIQTLESGHQSAGWYDKVWNGETANGKTISTGIYFARLVAGDYSQVIKMLYLK
jgi:predicted outer membrane repeat protein